MPSPTDNDWAPTLDTISMADKNIDVTPKSIIITGQPGSGKTTLAATAFGDISDHLTGKSTEKKILKGALWILTDEQGIVSLRVRGLMPEYLIDFREFVTKADGHVGKAIQWMQDMIGQAAEAGATTAVVDTITSFGAYLERYYIHGPGCPKAASGEKNTFGGWLALANKQFELFETISELGLRALWLAHPQNNKIEEAAEAKKATDADKAKAVVSSTPGDNWIIPAISGRKFREVLTGQCCISGWLRADFVNGKRKTTWMPFGGDGSQGKNRYEGILDREEPADLYRQDTKITNATK
jgi:hypothetical protein